MFRLIRIIRVLRLFKRFQSLNKVIKALSSSLLPVFNALIVLLVFTAVYSTLGTHIYRERSPQYFGNFARSFFTMVQVVSGDSWASAVARKIFYNEQEMETDVAVFFTTYFFIAAVVFLNVVVAVLLDEFTSAMAVEKELEAAKRRLENSRDRLTGDLDPLTRTLMTYEDEDDLIARIDLVYDRLDIDGQQSLSFDEFRVGLKRHLGEMSLSPCVCAFLVCLCGCVPSASR